MRTGPSISLPLLMLTGAAWAAEPFVLTSVPAAPAIDGKLGDACWKGARQYRLQANAGGDLKVGGNVALCYDPAGLSVALWLDEPTPGDIMAPRVAVNEPGIWDGEIIEWFICPSEDGDDYVQLAWNPAGSQFSARCVSMGSGTFRSDTTSRPQWQCASVVGATGWTTEARITFAELGANPAADGDRWRLNVNRTRRIGERVLQCALTHRRRRLPFPRALPGGLLRRVRAEG